MNESLAAACGEFEQILLAGMLRSAGIGRSDGADDDTSTDDGANLESRESSNAVQQLFVQALSGAIERSGGIGLARNLATALETPRP